MLEAQSKQTKADSFNNSAGSNNSNHSHNSASYDQSVFDEINKGDDFEESIIMDDKNDPSSGSDSSSGDGSD